MRDYEFRIFSAKGGVSLIVHSCHLTDSAAIRSAKAYAGAALYEFKLSSPRQEPLLFAAAFATDDQAVEHARRLLKRHPEMTGCEIWRGMQLLRQV